MNDSHDSGWFRDTSEARRLLEAERAKVDAMEAEFVAQATARLETLLDRLPDSTHVMAAKADLRAVLAENKTMRQRLTLVAEEVRELPEMCRWLVGPRCGEAYDRAREAHRLVGEWQPAGPAQDEQAATGDNDNNDGG